MKFTGLCKLSVFHRLLILTMTLLLVTSGSMTFAAVAGRAKIEGNTLVSAEGDRLRGGTFWLYGWISSKTTWALSDAPWEAMEEHGFNAVRLACGYRTDRENNYSLDRYEEILDELIERADEAGIYAVIDFHDTPGTYNMTSAKAFWDRFADRYKDKENVIFELTNEPKFDQPASYTSENLRDFEELWQICHDHAPQTPSIILSFCQVGYSGALPAEVADSLKGIDWSKTLVGFHGYWRDTSERIVDLKENYPCINTEFMCLTEGSSEMKAMDGHAYQGTLMEKLKISWLQWDILDREPSMTEKLPRVITDLKEQSLYWPEIEETPEDTTSTEPEEDTTATEAEDTTSTGMIDTTTPMALTSRGRPYISDNTFVTDKGTRLRGGTFWLYGWIPSKTAWAFSEAPWVAMRENGFNALRLSCGYRTDKEDNYSLDEYETILDSLITKADSAEVYVVIDFHDTPGTYNMDNARAFWERFSIRYKHCTNVLFELTNEPVFDQPESYGESNLRDFEELYSICDTYAPETPVIVLSFCQVGYSGALPSEVADNLAGIDWEKTAVGFHSYWRDSSERIVDLKENYPCINTEFRFVTEGTSEMKAMDGYEHHGTLMEKLEISWLQWDILDREPSLTDKLPLVMQDVEENNMLWVSDYELSTSSFRLLSQKAARQYQITRPFGLVVLKGRLDGKAIGNVRVNLHGKVLRKQNAGTSGYTITVK